MSLAAAPAGRAPHSSVHGGDAGSAASLIAPPGCGGGKAAAAALLCVACVRVRPAWGPPRVLCSAGGEEGLPAKGLGVAGPSVGFERVRRRVPGLAGGGGVRLSSRDLHPPRGLQPGGPGPTGFCREDPASRFTRAFSFSGSISEGVGGGESVETIGFRI